MQWFIKQSSIVQAFLASIFTWGMTAAGAALVFFFKEVKQTIMDSMLGFAAGVMVSASFFSLLSPALEYSSDMGVPGYIPTVTGFLCGCAFLWLADRLVPHMHSETNHVEGLRSKLGKSFLLILAVTLHNIPEGLAVGVTFGAAAHTNNISMILGAVALSIGMGIQNFPEGAAVSLPARANGNSVFMSWYYGQFSGLVEIPAAIIGALAVTYIQPILPFFMSFAAGAMIYVVFDELIPEAHVNGKNAIVTIMAVLGFAVMMLLDVSLG
jgi:ZIP family zinc transporter